MYPGPPSVCKTMAQSHYKQPKGCFFLDLWSPGKHPTETVLIVSSLVAQWCRRAAFGGLGFLRKKASLGDLLRVPILGLMELAIEAIWGYVVDLLSQLSIQVLA